MGAVVHKRLASPAPAHKTSQQFVRSEAVAGRIVGDKSPHSPLFNGDPRKISAKKFKNVVCLNRQYRNLPSCTPATPCPVSSPSLGLPPSARITTERDLAAPEPGSMLRRREAVVVYRRSVTRQSTGLDSAADGLCGCHAAGALDRLDFRSSGTTILL